MDQLHKRVDYKDQYTTLSIWPAAYENQINNFINSALGQTGYIPVQVTPCGRPIVS